MYSKRTVTLALTLLLLFSYCIIGFNPTPTEKREACLSNRVVRSKNDPYIRTRFAGGNGTEDDPYQISNVSQLQDMNLDLFANYTLVNDINASETIEWNNGKGFEPIARDTDPFKLAFKGIKFTGNLDGNGHNITGLFIDRPDENYVGLFGFIYDGATIGNLSMEYNNIRGSSYVGGIVGRNNKSTVENCHTGGNISGISYVGGIVGYNVMGIIKNCYVTSNVSGPSDVGGLVGLNYYSAVKDCYATGNISGFGHVGGLVGWNFNSTVEKCYATGYVTGDDCVGGLVGRTFDGTVEKCYANGNVRGYRDVGGMVGHNDGITIEGSHAIGNVNGFVHVGGFVGQNSGGVVKNCYTTGNVNGSDHVGGFMGQNSGDVVKNCYTTGNVSGEENVGGLVGKTDNDNLLENSHYNIDSVLINGRHLVTIGGLYNAQYDDWFTNGLVLDIADYHATLVAYGDGYMIKEVQGFKDLLGFVDNAGLRFRLGADIDLTTVPGLHIPFFSAGEFNGSGHIISNLNMDHPFASDVGMFGYIHNYTVIENLRVFGFNINGSDHIGGLVGWNDGGKLSNCSTMGNVTGDEDVGGIVGYNVGGTIKNCSSMGAISGLERVGGLVGYNGYGGTVENCYARGNVIGEENVGGIVGDNGFIVQNCSATVKVSGNLSVGGLVGWNRDLVRNCYAAGNVTGDESTGGLVGLNDDYGMINICNATGNVTGGLYVGGFVGNNRGIVGNCYATGYVTSDGDDIGGLVGLNRKMVRNCYATGNVIGGEDVGGLVGRGSGTIKNCYSTGNVTGDVNVGGLVGSNSGGIEEYSFWDTEISGQLNSSKGKGKATLEMMTKSTFTEAGWDFDTIWAINEYVDYPHLQWEQRPNIEADDSDNDSIPDIIDDFPNNPAASFDTDRDGSPDRWNPGMNETNSTTGLHLDAFPLDPAASLDTDGDGIPDKWNPGMNHSDSTSNPPLELDIYPNDPNNKSPDDDNTENPTDSSSKTWIWISLGIVAVILIALFIALSVRSKRKSPENEVKDDLGRVERSDDK
ncbi:MAG: GLUG motif-containing protein [Candidatus Thermoplasmatota archaeon]|nr:GLUG motif-containing protein [Candidatus Thermoplasmatota archaeon]